jgi:hypothetical protein
MKRVELIAKLQGMTAEEVYVGDMHPDFDVEQVSTEDIDGDGEGIRKYGKNYVHIGLW